MPAPSPAPERHRARLLLALLVLAAFALRAATLGVQSLWRDEVDAVYFALRPLSETLAMFTAMAQNGPLYFLGLRPWLQAVGSSEFALRLPSAFAGVIAVPLLWQVARRIVGGPALGAPLLAAVLLVLNPYALWYSQEGKMYAIVTALALAAHWCWLRGIDHGGWRPWLAYTAIVSLALYMHLLMVLLLPLHLLWCAIAWPAARRHWRGIAASFALLTLPYLPLLAWQWPMLRSAEKLTGFSYTPLLDILKTTLLNHARGFMPGDPLWLFVPLFFAGALGLLLAWAELPSPSETPDGESAPLPLSPRRRYLVLVAWLVVPILSIWLLSLRQPVFTDRYVIWALPAGLIFAALGVQAVRANLGRAGAPLAFLLAAAICAAWLAADWQQTTQTIKYDLRGGVRYVAARRDPDTLLLLQIPHLEHAYRYYSGDQGTAPFAGSDARLGNWAGGLWTNHPADDTAIALEVDAQMRSLTAGAADLWLMLSETEMWDQRRLMVAWLEQHGTLLEQADFHGVQVRHIALSP